jgi:hypothetical protein
MFSRLLKTKKVCLKFKIQPQFTCVIKISLSGNTELKYPFLCVLKASFVVRSNGRCIEKCDCYIKHVITSAMHGQ